MAFTRLPQRAYPEIGMVSWAPDGAVAICDLHWGMRGTPAGGKLTWKDIEACTDCYVESIRVKLSNGGSANA